MATLTEKTTSSLRWSAIERIFERFFAFGVQLLLARLIDPTEFGVLALLTIFLAFSNLLIISGLGQALVQKPEISRADISTVFFFNIVVALFLYSLLFYFAPSIATFYSEPRLVVLVRVLSLGFVISSFGQVQRSLFQRDLRFKSLFWISTPALFSSAAVGVVLAFMGFGVWALVAMQLTGFTVSTFCYWYLSERKYWPDGSFSFQSLTTLGRFGLGILGSSFMNQGVQHLYGLLIGKYFSLGELAFYDRARTFHRKPALTLGQIISRVMFPVISKISNDNARICSAMRKGIPVLACVVIPAMALVIVTAEHLVVVLITAKWLPAVEYMRWFPIIGMLMPIGALHWSILLAKGKSWTAFWLGMLKNLVGLLVLIATVQHGILAIVIGQVAVSVFANGVVNSLVARFIYEYRLRDQYIDYLPYMAVAAVAGFAAYYCDTIMTGSHLLILLVQSVVFVSIYVLLCWLLRLQGFKMAVVHANNVLGRRSRQLSKASS